MGRIADFFFGPTVKREEAASPPTIEDLVSDFWDRLRGVGVSPRLLDRVWAANRCIHLNSQMIGGMPIRFFGPDSATEPAWLSSPDPVWYPNGIGDAVRAIVRSIYGWGDAFIYVTSRYATGFPSAWTVLDPEPVTVRVENGRRRYRSGQTELDPDNVVHISRNPGSVRGVSAIAAYGSLMWGSIAQGDLSRVLIGDGGGIPNTVLKSHRTLTPEGAREIQDTWIRGRARVGSGVPAVLPPEIDIQELQFSPKDLLLLDAQEFNARVIATAFGVPAFLLNIPVEGGMLYQNPAMLFEHWWRTELRHPAHWIQSALSANMLPRGSWVEFDAREVLAPNFKDLVEAWKLIVSDMGAAEIDEFRAAVLRLPPQSLQDSIEDLITPPVAATSGQTNGVVTPLRPTQEVAQ